MINVQNRNAIQVNWELWNRRRMIDAIVQAVSRIQEVQTREMELLEYISARGQMYRGPQRLQTHQITHQLPLPLPLPAPESPIGSSSREVSVVKGPAIKTLLGKLADACNDPSVKGLTLAVRPVDPFSCRKRCNCACHKMHKRRSSGPMNMILGCLFLGYSGFPTSSCNEWACRKRTSTTSN